MNSSTEAALARYGRLQGKQWAGAAVVLVWSVVAVLFRDPLYDNLALVSSISTLAATVFFLAWRPPPGQEGFRLLGVFVGGQTFLSAGLSIISPVDPPRVLPAITEESFSFAIQSAVVFSGMFLLGAVVTSPRGSKTAANPPGPESGPIWSVALALAVGTVLVTNYIALTTSVESVNRLGTLPLIIFSAGLIAPLILATGLLSGRSMTLPLAIVIAGQALMTFYSSMLGVVIYTLRDLILVLVYLRRRLPMRLIGAAVAIFVLLNPAKSVFRGSLAAEGRSGSFASLEEASGLWEEAIVTTWLPDRRSATHGSDELQTTTRRLDYNWLSAHVYLAVPARVPYEMGGTYEDIPVMLVPRVLYPEKPISATHTRSRWLVKLGIQTRQTIELAAIALPASAEAYWNFGWPGVFGVPFLLGLLVGMMLRLGPKDAAARTAYVVLLVTTLGQFLDMLVWVLPQFAVVAVSGLLAFIYCRLGRLNVLRRVAFRAPPQATR